MDFVTELFVVMHLLGMAAIVGGYLAVRHQPRIIAPMLWGARAQVLTGLILVGFAQMGDEGDKPNNAKIAVKLLVALAVLACTEIASARQRKAVAATALVATDATGPAPGLVHAAAGLAVLNVLVAALWK